MKKALILITSFIALAALPLAAEEPTNKDDDFFDDATVEVPAGEKETDAADEVLDKESVTFSGDIDATGAYTLTRDFLWGFTDIDDNVLSYYLTGDLLLDARLRKGFRAFADLNIGYSNVGIAAMHTYNLLAIVTGYDTILGNPIVIPPNTLFIVSENQDMLIGIKELFVDLNFGNAVYFRIGKQVLQWGRGYLWNPTDLINIEKKSFFDMSALRDGTFGLRMDLVFDRAFRINSYVQFQDAEDFSQMAVAGKAEFLIGSVEQSLSAWWKGGKIPVFGYDVSAPLPWDVNFHGEAAFSWGDNLDRMETDGTVTQVRDVPVVRASIGFSKGFTVDDIENRVLFNTEFYFNSQGYDEDMFETLDALPEGPMFTRTVALTNFFGSCYDANNYGKYYGMLAVTVTKFLVSQLTLTISGLGNFSDLSFIAMADLSYAPVYNFTLSFKLLSYIGLNLREYTMAPQVTGTAVSFGNNMFAANLSCSVKF